MVSEAVRFLPKSAGNSRRCSAGTRACRGPTRRSNFHELDWAATARERFPLRHRHILVWLRLVRVREWYRHRLFTPLDILLVQIYSLPRMSTKADQDRIELLQGTLDLLILRTLSPGPAHGHAIAKTIERNSEETLQVEQGSLYPALHRLIKRGWISSEEGTSENNRRAKFYRLTPEGRKQLRVETTKWDKLARAIGHILRPAHQKSNI
jgi:PadR family transcriptional regulator, regulatory protein PadR